MDRRDRGCFNLAYVAAGGQLSASMLPLYELSTWPLASSAVTTT